MLKKPNAAEVLGKVSKPFADDCFKMDYPTLSDYLTQDRWEDGKPRITATLSLSVSGGVFVCFINDRDANRSACVEALEFIELLINLERGLKEDLLTWKVRGKHTGNSNGIPF